MSRVALVNALLLDPEASEAKPGGLLLDGERIASHLGPGERVPESARRVDLGGLALAPGFLDIHYHGALVFGPVRGAGAALASTARELLASGVTGFLPTTVAWPEAELAQRVGALAEACAGSVDGATPLGLHLEGPWIAPAAAGAQPAAGIRDFTASEGTDLFERGQGLLRMVTFAPELPGTPALLAELGRRGIVAALGHSEATSEQAEAAIERGAQHVTHLWNAMSGIHHRAPGLAGVALADDRLSSDVICDGVHVHPTAVRLAARMKQERLLLITDRVAAGSDFGSGDLVDDGTALRLADGRLAGSRLTLDLAVANAVAFGAMSRLEAIAAATLRPARLLGLEGERGTLRPGARADLAVLDSEGAITATWLAGRAVYPVA